MLRPPTWSWQSYMIAEVSDAEQSTLTELMWTKTRDTLLIVEPGTPAGYARILTARRQLIASGAHLPPPPPHQRVPPHSAPLGSLHTKPPAISRAQTQHNPRKP